MVIAQVLPGRDAGGQRGRNARVACLPRGALRPHCKLKSDLGF